MHRFARRVIFGACAAPALLAVVLHANVRGVSANRWAASGHMAQGRAGAAATLMYDGHVIVSGGSASGGASASVERYSPGADVFLATPPMLTARAHHSSTLLPDGRVLVAGGVGADGSATSAAEIYDPETNAWAPAASMSFARSTHTATALYDGRVVIAGGGDGALALDTIEIYDPDAGVFVLSDARLSAARTGHATAQLYDGTLLVVGGFDGISVLSSVDIFDPFSNTVVAGPALASPRAGHTATTLLSGRVLVAGGRANDDAVASAESYDPATNGFVPAGTSMVAARQNHQTFLLPHNNQVLIVGGTAGARAGAVAAAEVYVEWQGTGGAFYPTNVPTAARAWATGAPLSFHEALTLRSGPNDGLLLLAGGRASADAGSPFKSSELYGFATVVTDKADYAPGSKVTITGGGWVPGEPVSLTLAADPARDVHAPRTVVADAAGRIVSTEFVPDANDEGIRFFLTASGQHSQAQTSFTNSTTWLNETDLPGEADYAVLQFPAAFTPTGAPSPTLFGRIFEAGVTPAAGASPTVVAEIGYGPAGTDPRTTAGWVWAPATFNVQVGNDDEYRAVLTLQPGGYSYTFRFSLDSGASFTLADLDGAGSNAGLTFSTAQMGTATVAPTLSQINPVSALQGAIAGVTLTGTAFQSDVTSVTVSGPGIAVSNVTVVDSSHLTATFTIAGGAPPTARAVTVTTPGGTSGSVSFTVLETANPPVTWLNETDVAAEADYAALQFPATFIPDGGPSPTLFGRLFELGVTEAAGSAPAVVAQVGYGPAGTDARTTAGWVWAPATFNGQVGNDDEYQAVLTLPAGAYSYTFRFSLDGGFSFTLADLDGAGANAGLTFSIAQMGTAMVAPTLSQINPVSASQGATVGVTLTGTAFQSGVTNVAVSGIGIVVSDVSVADSSHVTATFAIAGGAPPTARAVTVTTPGGTSGSVSFTVLETANPPVTWLNETDVAAEADYAALQFPATFIPDGGPSPTLFGRLFELGVTEAAGSAPAVVAQVGYGPAGTDARTTAGWVWAPAAFNAQVGNDDEYQAVLTLPAGAYSYTFRFSLDGGFSFTLGDLDGAGANPGLTFSTAQLGTTTGIPLAVHVVSPNGGEQVFASVPTTVRWSVTGTPASFDVAYSRDNGASFTALVACTTLPASARSCSWTPVGPATTTALIRVTAHDGGAGTAADVSDAVFSISTGSPLLTVAAPNAAVMWAVGTTQSINWSHNLGANAFMHVELSRNGGASWEDLAASVLSTTPTSGTLSWTVTGPTTNTALVRVTALDAPAADVSNLTFSIAAGASCTDALTLAYAGGTLNLGFTVASSAPATFSTWLVYPGGALNLWSAAIPAITPAVVFNLPLAGFPSIGTVGVFTLISAPSWPSACYDWQTVDTGGAVASSH